MLDDEIEIVEQVVGIVQHTRVAVYDAVDQTNEIGHALREFRHRFQPTTIGILLQSKLSNLIHIWDDIQSDTNVVAVDLKNRPRATRISR